MAEKDFSDIDAELASLADETEQSEYKSLDLRDGKLDLNQIDAELARIAEGLPYTVQNLPLDLIQRKLV